MEAALVCLTLVLGAAPDSRPFAIHVVDEATGRGVPLVELTTTGNVTYVTDSSGLVAFDEPGLMNSRVFFSVKSHGYEFAKDGFGMQGRALDVSPGGSAKLSIRRMNIAERLYRVTGAGIYRDTVLLGREAPIDKPLLNARTIGCDSVMNALYRGKLYWFWGDTNRPEYPLGNFHITGATSRLPGDGGLSPSVGVNLSIFAGDDGFARPMAKMPGDGPTWIVGLAVLPDAAGRERMVCHYLKIKPPLTAYRWGLAQWDDQAEAFQHVADHSPRAPAALPHSPTLTHDEPDGRYVYFCSPLPLVRTRATCESYFDLTTYEAFTCLKAGSSIEQPEIDRDDAGRARYAWRKHAPPLFPGDEARFIREGKLTAEEAISQLRDAATGETVVPHFGSIAWNEYRQRYVMIAVQQGGKSFLGEVWYAESPKLAGPWSKAIKIVTHDKYSFYNPKQHPYFAEDAGRYLYFEGTYTTTFSGNQHPTPRYDYNQIMYRLDLADERLQPSAGTR
jgi:hypothetical protein